MKMKIVFLDFMTIGEDIDLSKFSQLGEVITYDNSTEEEAALRSREADVLIVNKVNVNEKTISQADHLKLVCVSATGTNNLDKDYLAKRGIPWKNVAGYSTNCVAQHTFALLFYLLEKLPAFDQYVKSGDYASSSSFTWLGRKYHEIAGLTWGIIGLGAIGRKVADIASAFGAHVIYASASGKAPQEGYEQVSLDELYERSDIISIHAPLNEYTHHLLNKEAFSKMKDSCILLNLGRGPIVVEEDLYEALVNGNIAAAGLDVLEKEPMSPDHPLLKIQDSGKLIITPHIAWAGIETRKRLMDMVYEQIDKTVSCISESEG